MTMIANLLALALIAADEPSAPPVPVPPTGVNALPNVSKPRTDLPDSDEVWNLTLPEAIRIGLVRCENVRVNQHGVSGLNALEIQIAQLNRDASIWRFKAEVMAHVRSIEQQYWSLSQMQVALWSRKTAVKLGEEILKQERAELANGHSTSADVAEAEQQLENFKLNLVSATSDLITAERQLRDILDLPPTENRRIVPATMPTETQLKPDWETSLAEMIASQPDIAEHRRLVRTAELKALIDGDNPTQPVENREATRRELEIQKASFEQARHQATHALARFFLEVDANFKQLQTAQKLRAAAQQRLEAQRSFHEEGKVTIDRLLDAVSQYANAVAQESQYKSSYNTSIVALEEAKGTLLAFDKITVVEPAAHRTMDAPPAKVDQVAPAAFEAPFAPMLPARAASVPGPKTFKIKARLVPGGLDLDIEVHEGPAATPVNECR